MLVIFFDVEVFGFYTCIGTYNINFGRFYYVRDFIDMIINFKIENTDEIKYLDVSELESLMNKFLDEKSG